MHGFWISGEIAAHSFGFILVDVEVIADCELFTNSKAIECLAFSNYVWVILQSNWMQIRPKKLKKMLDKASQCNASLFLLVYYLNFNNFLYSSA